MYSLPPNNISIDDITNYLSNIDGNDIQDETITNAKIADGTITNAKISSVDGSKITNNSIADDKLANNYATINGSFVNIFYAKKLQLKNLNTWYLEDYEGYFGLKYFKIVNSSGSGGFMGGALGTEPVNMLDFTGQHTTFFINKNVYKGYIVCSIGEFYDKKSFKKNNIDIIDTLPKIELSYKAKDKSVFGVISDKYQNFNLSPMKFFKERNEYYETPINSLGEGAIWVSNFNGNLENGDYITSSDIPGIGMKQDDDILHNYTVAKITMDCDFNPQYIPIEKMKNNTSNIILDDNDNIIYEYEYDEQNNIKYDYEYEIKYIRLNGDIIDKITYDNELSSNLPVYKMAFVGCTYHCG